MTTITAFIRRTGYRDCDLSEKVEYMYVDSVTSQVSCDTDIMYDTDVLAIKANGCWWTKEGYHEDVEAVLQNGGRNEVVKYK